MREIFVNQDYTKVGHYKSILESASIPCFIRNGTSHNSVTELPSPLLFPTLCVENDDDYERALELLKAVHKPSDSNAPDWKCPNCNETIPGSFDSCWSCNHEPVTKTSIAASAEATPENIPTQDGTNEFRVAVNRLRMMILIKAVVEIGFYIAGESAFLKLDVYPPNALTGADSAFSIFAFPIRMLSLVLCFFLMRVGRTLLFISVATSMILYHGTTGGIPYREIGGITWLADLLLGAILAMMFFSPASVYFQNKRTETGR
ncbi:MAG: hypothetical protein RL088_3889 [Verrucomicrobiota bacterium]|jgi:hypothetical protein